MIANIYFLIEGSRDSTILGAVDITPDPEHGHRKFPYKGDMPFKNCVCVMSVNDEGP